MNTTAQGTTTVEATRLELRDVLKTNVQFVRDHLAEARAKGDEGRFLALGECNMALGQNGDAGQRSVRFIGLAATFDHVHTFRRAMDAQALAGQWNGRLTDAQVKAGCRVAVTTVEAALTAELASLADLLASLDEGAGA